MCLVQPLARVQLILHQVHLQVGLVLVVMMMMMMRRKKIEVDNRIQMVALGEKNDMNRLTIVYICYCLIVDIR